MDVKEIIFTKNNDKLIIDFLKQKVIYQDIIYIIEKDLLKKYLKNFMNITFNWQKEYINNTLIDGYSWEVLVLFNDDSFKKYKGHNLTPDNFEVLKRLNDNLLQGVR